MAALRCAAKRGVEQLEKSRMQNARDGWLQAPKNSVVRATNGWPHDCRIHLTNFACAQLVGA